VHNIKKDCPICGYGTVGFFRCSDGKNIVLVCSECYSTWLSPDEVFPDNADGPQPPDYKLTDHECAIKGGSAGWATMEEISKVGWSKFVS
jgi:hypothetical protein